MTTEVLRHLLAGTTHTVVDATVGAGGHADAILSASDSITLIGIDRDPAALDAASRRLERFGRRFCPVHASFADVLSVVGATGSVDAVLADLGVSSMQIDDGERGFSYRMDAPLDMRMGRDGETAAELVARMDVDGIAGVLREFGEVSRPRRLAAAIKRASGEGALATTLDLRRVVDAVFGSASRPALLSRIFQALRVAVNAEIEQLEAFLPAAVDALTVGGRIVVISYHSLEDRAVKRFFRAASRSCVCPPGVPVCVCGWTPRLEVLTKRVVVAGPSEVQRNSRARSARMRAARTLVGGGGC
jgi:16S rRNA (cytosine1402-N4)-methyltransferase